MSLPEPQYALEVVAWAVRHLHRGGDLERMGYGDAWDTVFYGRPEFQPCIQARIAAQEALWSERPETLRAEASEVFGPDAQFAVSITHGLVKFRRDKPFPEPLKTSYRMSLARDEFESFQVVAASTGRRLRNVQVSVQWEGAGPHPEVVLRPVGYVQTKPDPDNFTGYIGLWPDPLMPPGAADVATGETQPFWGTVHATSDTPPGDHHATVTVSADGMQPLHCALTVHVLDFDLGLTHLPSLLALSFESIRRFYRITGDVPQDVKRRWYEFCLRYRMNPNLIYGTGLQPGEEDLQFCIERGFNAMVICTPPLYRETRNTRETVELWVSDDNVAYRRVDGAWTLTSDERGNLLLDGLDVTARFFKLHSLLTDRGGQFAVPNLQAGQFVAYGDGQSYTGPAGWIGPDDGTKPLTAFNADWGAALDYERASIGVDLGQPRRVQRMQVGAKQFEEIRDIKRFYDVAKAHGLGDRAYVYGFDEWADVSTYDQIRDTFQILKEQAPGLKACTTASQPVPPATEVVDAWCPALCYQYAEYEAERQRGKEIWYYEGGAPYDPFPTHELLNVPAVEARAFFWIAWRYQLAGWLHWELNYWGPNLQGEGRWPDVPWDPARAGVRNGEVGRIYPGPNVTPLPSVRLENMRDGIEDYDYFWVLNEALQKLPDSDPRKAAGQKLSSESIQMLCPSRAHFERDPETVLAIHERLGRAIEALHRGA
jgi:hypothetical protein